MKRKMIKDKMRTSKPISWKKIPRILLWTIVAGLATLVLLTVLLVTSRPGAATVVLQVGDTRVTQGDYNSYIEELEKKGVEEKDAREQLVTYYKQLTAQKEAGISIPQYVLREQQQRIDDSEDLSPMQLKIRVQRQALERVVALAQFTGVDAYYVVAGYAPKESNRSWLPTVEEAKKLVVQAKNDRLKMAQSGHPMTSATNPTQLMTSMSFFLEDGSRVSDSGVPIGQGIAIPQIAIQQYLNDCKEGICGVRVDDEQNVVYFMDVIHRQKQRIEKVQKYQAALERVRVVEYDR